MFKNIMVPVDVAHTALVQPSIGLAAALAGP